MALTPEQRALANHRFERAVRTLEESEDELSRNNFRLSVNRSYHAVFYAMRALLATVDKDSSKHSGVIALFNRYFIKTGIVPEVSFKSIQALMDLRHEGDYQDFAEINEDEAKGAIVVAEGIIIMLNKVLGKIVETDNK
ncbi:MAG: HEPN domain-containing protein [Nitrospirae bacterium]|nr:HEPN domain-containing protein [Nitrospirota bacterium]